MKKILIPVALVALAGAAYLYQQQQPQQTKQPAYNVLNYVPADTAIFTGQLTPFPIKDYLASIPSFDSQKEILLSEILEEESPAINFAQNILSTYQDALKNPEILSTNFGLADEIRAYFYTIGLLPVFKAEIANPQVLWDFLDKNEKETGFNHIQGKLNEQTYRLYRLTDDSVDADKTINLIIAENNGILTLTITTKGVSEQLLSTALGLTKPVNPISDTSIISDTAKQHNLSKSNIGFINHVEIIKGLTTTDGNLIAKQITELMKEESNESLTMIQNEVCHREFNSIAQNWPRTVFGYTKMDITKEETTMGMSTIVESKNKVILDSLQALRGYIPAYVQGYENKIASIGIAFNVSNLSGSLANIFTDLVTPSYQCLPLHIVQQEIAKGSKPLGMVGMFANMATGIQGLSATIFDYKIKRSDTDTKKVEHLNIDALIAVHAESPKTTFDTLKMMVPGLSQLSLTVDGPSVSLKSMIPFPPEFKEDPQVAIRGNHFVIYNGEIAKKEAENLSNEKLSANGLYRMAFDLSKMMSPIINEIEKSEEDGLPPEVKNLLNYEIRVDTNADINSEGIRFDVTFNTKSAK
ncbi:hypothetical protein [Psychromonas sp. SP041]|uniref:hypothetical protein n=1 Tax=Psychromonas sp. SP041 TaxID=1365007 RepID=UPI00041A9ABA|nr:hypothetical protein [Psychromonas sp. SP041]